MLLQEYLDIFGLPMNLKLFLLLTSNLSQFCLAKLVYDVFGTYWFVVPSNVTSFHVVLSGGCGGTGVSSIG